MLVRCAAASLVAALVTLNVATAQEQPLTRQAFDRQVRQQANPNSLGTDVAGAWSNIYRYLIPARLLDRKAYEQAMLNMAKGDQCPAAKTRGAKLSCIANGAARAAGSLSLAAESVELRRDAVRYAEEGARTNPGPLLDALLLLGFDEVRHGSLADAEASAQRATGLIGRDRRLATAQRLFRLAVLNARLADARLDDAGALQWLRQATAAAPQVDPMMSSEDPLARRPLDDLLILHLAGRFCAACGAPLAEPVRDYLRAELGKGSSSEYLLMALAAPAGAFSKEELTRFATARLKELPSLEAIEAAQRFRAARMDEVEVARLLALPEVITPNTVNTDAVLAFLNESDRARQAEAGRKLLKAEQDSAEELGAMLMFLEQLPRAAWFLEQAGRPRHARVVLEYMVEALKGTSATGVTPTMVKLATIVGPAFTRLAALQLAGGDRDAARRSLIVAEEIAVARLRSEWNRGSENAILAIRDLSDSLHLAARTWHALVAPSGPAERSPDAERVFRAMQLATMGETALTLGVAAQRRVLARPQAAELRGRALRAAADAERFVQIAGNSPELDVDRVLTRTRDRLAAEAGQLRAELSAMLPGITLDGAEIAPAELRAVAGRLGPGEAFVILRVGAASLDGILLDQAGGTVVWSTAIRDAEVERLVKALRDAADISSGRPLPFPYADAFKLYQTAFGPVASQLRRYSRLIVLGNGPLQSMPYGALLTAMPRAVPPAADRIRAAQPAWLVRSHAIALVPSAATFVAQRAEGGASKAARPFLGIGNPVLAPAQSAERRVDRTRAFKPGGLADVEFLRRQSSLPETEDELRAIATLLKASPDDIVVQARATETNVKALPLSDYAIVSFATHGALAGEVSGSSEPGLILTPPAAATAEDDGFLALSEVQALKFDADLVILSACNTGTSDGRPRAEGLSGLARGFFRAGARSMLVTHWAIPSESSAKLITSLIAERARDPRLDWADALRAASLALMDREGPAEWAHPAFWAGFAAVGVRPAGR